MATNILQKYFSRDLALKFTAVNKLKDKELFTDYMMCSCISSKNVLLLPITNKKLLFLILYYCLAVLMERFQENEESVLSMFGRVFNNAKDWDGGQKNRNK